MTKKKFTLTFTETDGFICCDGENIGFTGIELVGLLNTKMTDIIDQINGRSNFKRYVVNEEGERLEIVKEDDIPFQEEMWSVLGDMTKAQAQEAIKYFKEKYGDED